MKGFVGAHESAAGRRGLSNRSGNLSRLPPKQQPGFRPASPDNQATRPGSREQKGTVNVMKQFVQNLKVLRTMSGRFLAVAVLSAAALTFTSRAQADPGQGAVVTHIGRDLAGRFYTESADGQLRLEVVLSGQGDFFRHNPDGTWTLQTIEPKAPMTVSVRGGDGGWVPVWVGDGSFHDTYLAEPAGDGSWNGTGEAEHLHVEGQLANLLDGSKWSLLVVAEVVDFEFKELKVELQPR